MAALLAARFGRLFAASGVHSGVMYRAATNAIQALDVLRRGAHCAPAESAHQLVSELGQSLVFVPTIVIHGSVDTVVNPLNATQIVEQLCALANQLSPHSPPLEPDKERMIDRDGRTYRQRDFQRGGRVLVRSLLVEDLGHAWSGGDATYKFNDAEGPDASHLIAEFVLQFRTRGPVALPDSASLMAG